MKKVEISEQLLRDLHYYSSPFLQIMMEKELGREVFDPFYCIKSYEDACVDLGIIPFSEDDLFKRYNSEKEISFHKLNIIAKAINKKGECSYLNLVYFPVFKKDDFSGTIVFDEVYSLETTKERTGIYINIFYQSEEAAEYAGKTFTDLYEKFLIL